MTFNKKEYNLSPMLAKGLEEGGFKEPKPVQSKIIPMALARKNIVCSAATGSGKTLAFLVPAVEILLRAKWSRADGLGAVIITPTRELALQIFSVLQVIGRNTHLSGGLLIGGRSAEREKELVGELNIVVCTPGRLLEHLENAWNFSGDNIQCLVIDEADKLMEMGFKETVEKILEYMTKKRQTLLFSATADSIAQARKLWDIESPEFVSISSKPAEEEGVRALQHFAHITTPAQKLDLLYATIRDNRKKRIIVFLSTCKEVTFYCTLIKKMRIGLASIHLSGNMSQNKRVETYYKFSEKEPKVLFCTDIAARGLDFTGVDIVLQLDAPESKETYIHRAGRTARNGAKGKNILAVSPHEVNILKDLEEIDGFPQEVVKYKGRRSVEERVKGIIKQVPEIYLLAQKYVKTYKGFLRVSKKEYVADKEKALQELIEYLGVQEDENVSWSGEGKKKPQLLNKHTKLD
ncbi:ATP-dependent RNA helicase DDX10/DBP4 [Nematocida minor]|uniref:ATP-dependent RNA helicase DDX10/DBP4 n=1 Tax=Nematocida minor TaxID=1912983 RepID=UPI00221EF191|nr:ATP-dependent RNA helicase DDX10/DBP4 [Nematocida minor]KAI5190701.1 ATP-dependent RNA helicase DDX10/DBP4 [Nematocida minor]